MLVFEIIRVALQAIGALDDIPVVVAYTGDEEMAGRPLSISRKHLVEAGEWADVGLGFESAITYDGADWGTIARRSSSNWILTGSRPPAFPWTACPGPRAGFRTGLRTRIL